MKIEQNPKLTNQSFWTIFTAAPHRMMFFAGAVQLILPLLLWMVELIGRHSGLWQPLHTLVPSTWAHGFIMLYGVFSFFIFGFLMTVYPRWMNGPLVGRKAYIGSFFCLGIGIILFEIGIFFNMLLAKIGLCLFLAGWAAAQFSLLKVYRTAPARNKNYETILNISLTAGWLGAGSFLLFLFSNDGKYQFLSMQAGLWLYLVPVLFTVSHRMIPFFSSNIISDYKVYQPRWTIFVMLICCLGHFTLKILYLDSWLFIADAPLAFVAALHSIKWQLQNSFADRLLAVLHIAFLWLSIGMALLGLQSVYLLYSGELILAKGPLHAIAIGFISSLLIAMASRVSLGHSGRPLVLDGLTWILFFCIQSAALLRVFADASALNLPPGLNLNIISALIWVASIGVWVLRFAPFYISARVDGRSG